MKKVNAKAAFKNKKKARAEALRNDYVLNLFVAGATARSHQAVLSVNEICSAKLKGRYSLNVFDIFQQPELAKENQIVVTPTLIKVSPLQMRRFIGIQGIITGLKAELEMNAGLGKYS
jgi:circadian clock protein KaiB